MDPVASRYEILSELGSGAMGTVHLAADTRLGREVALKMVHGHLLINDKIKERFMNEARATASLSHENIVSLFDVDEDERPFLVMEYIKGNTLEYFLQKDGVLPNLVLLEIARQLFEGLAAAHEKGIVHRDIKPANLLIDERGCLKITDFGVARVLHQEVLTATGQFVGTPQYVSPEIVKAGEITDRADIFSAGCVLYRCAAGIPPFRGENPHQVMRQICDLEPVAAGDSNPRLLPFTGLLLQKLLAKEPSGRHSASEVVGGIEDFSLENRIKLGKWRLKEYAAGPEEYEKKEAGELKTWFLNLAEEQKKKGKAAQAHRSLYQAGLFDEENKGRQVGRLQDKKKSNTLVLLLALILAVAGWIGIKQFFSPSLNEGNQTPARKDSLEIIEILPGSTTADLLMDTASIKEQADSTEKKGDREVVEKTVGLPMKNRQVKEKSPVKQESGYLTVKTRPPFASIYIDGRMVGTTPIKVPVELKSGFHLLRAEKQGCEPLSRKIKVSAKDTLKEALVLRRAK